MTAPQDKPVRVRRSRRRSRPPLITTGWMVQVEWRHLGPAAAADLAEHYSRVYGYRAATLLSLAEAALPSGEPKP